jgi:hypothetical protein
VGEKLLMLKNPKRLRNWEHQVVLKEEVSMVLNAGRLVEKQFSM